MHVDLRITRALANHFVANDLYDHKCVCEVYFGVAVDDLFQAKKRLQGELFGLKSQFKCFLHQCNTVVSLCPIIVSGLKQSTNMY